MPKGVLRPLPQGHVDGMCGVYSVMNACNLLLDDPLADENKQFDRDEAFFTALCRKVLPRFPNIVYDGVEGDGVELVIDGAKHWLAKKEKRKLVFSQPVLRKRGGTPALGEERVLFSVDYPYEDCSVAAEFIETAPISETARGKICHGNAERLLRLLQSPGQHSFNRRARICYS